MPRKTETQYERVEAIHVKADAFLHCYTLGHQWDDYPGDEWDINWKSLQFRPVSFRCGSCGTVRREFWNRLTGELCLAPARRYIYPDAYSVGRLVLDGISSSRRELFRAEYLDRKGAYEER